MGHTHYFSFKSSRGNSEKIEELYQRAIKDCNKIIQYWQKQHKGTELSLSGYSAHTKGKYGGIKINGKGDMSCEDFCLREHYNQNGSDCCKTRQYPYDTVVVACLATLEFYLRDHFLVSSDGDYIDWVDGVELANKALKRTKNKITIPFSISTLKAV